MSVFSVLRRVATAFARHIENTRAVAELERMSDHELQDIGLQRSQIEDFVYGRLQRPAADPALVRPGLAANARRGPVTSNTPAHAA